MNMYVLYADDSHVELSVLLSVPIGGVHSNYFHWKDSLALSKE